MFWHTLYLYWLIKLAQTGSLEMSTANDPSSVSTADWPPEALWNGVSSPGGKLFLHFNNLTVYQ